MPLEVLEHTKAATAVAALQNGMTVTPVVVSPRMSSDLHLALALADAADAITMRHYQSASLAVRTKIDMTPVSEADEAVERMIRERIAILWYLDLVCSASRYYRLCIFQFP
jgi:3'-phosphoadenosine 5'-phosphosulfate (PAPS) 3'-phosphatase